MRLEHKRLLVRATIVGVVYGCCMAAARLATHAARWEFAQSLPEVYGPLPIHAAAGIAVGSALVATRVSTRVLGWFALTLMTVLSVAAFEYERTFGRLPTVGAFAYLEDLSELRASVEGRAIAVFVLSAIVLALGAAAVRVTRNVAETRWRWAAFATAALSAVAVYGQIGPPQGRWSSRHPIVWLLESQVDDRHYETEASDVGREDVWHVQRALGHDDPFGGTDPRYPLCRPEGLPEREGNRRSVIVVILESVGSTEVFSRKLRSLDAWRPGTTLQVMATADRSAQALPAIFAGQPAQPLGNLLHTKPVVAQDGFPRHLARKGYHTAYFHGSDLSFENQREFLKLVGFQELFELDPTRAAGVWGWGHADEDTFERMTAWIEKHRREAPETPYFAALFTLSTHDPYVLPDSWPRRASDVVTSNYRDDWLTQRVSPEVAFDDALAYLDAQLKKFLDWYYAHEERHGTVLIVIGDHSSPVTQNMAVSKGSDPPYLVPLFVEHPNSNVAHGDVDIPMQMDLPSTLAGLLEIETTRCDQGVDLLDPHRSLERWGISVGAEESELVLWTRAGGLVHDRATGSLRWRTDARDNDSFKPRIEAEAKVFLKAFLPLSYYLISRDAYAQRIAVRRRTPLQRVNRPLFVSHKGNVHGARPPLEENRAAAIREASQAGFDFIEVDTQLTRDGVAVVSHDPNVRDADAKDVAIASLTLEELRALPGYETVLTLPEALAVAPEHPMLVEAKPQMLTSHSIGLSREIIHALRAEPEGRKFMVDSFSTHLAGAIKPTCHCDVGLDLPGQVEVNDAMLDAALTSELDWIFVHHSVTPPELVARAHERGLKVMVYTAATIEDVAQLHSEPPDGIITDSVAVMRAW